MPGNSRAIARETQRRFPVRITLAVPPAGFGQRLDQMSAWLDENCGADGWAIIPAGTRGVENDAVGVYFRDATLAAAFVTRWCVAGDVEGIYRPREDAPAKRIRSAPHKSPLG